MFGVSEVGPLHPVYRVRKIGNEDGLGWVKGVPFAWKTRQSHILETRKGFVSIKEEE